MTNAKVRESGGPGIHVLKPQLRRTSEVRYHSDLAPGRRFVFVGRVIDPICHLYIVGREVDQIPADQPEWLEDHRHNCPTFYVLIGRSLDLTGLAAEIVIEGHRFIAESPSAIMLPPGFAHHHRLIEGGGWSFHVNVRPDYEDSLMPAARGDPPAGLHVNRLYQRAESGSMVNGWEIDNGVMPADQNHNSPVFWKFIDPDHFETPGVRLHAQWLSGGTHGSETMHSHTADEVMILLSYTSEPLTLEARSETLLTTAQSPITLYAPAGVAHACRYVSGAGLVLKFLRLPWDNS